MATPLKRFRLIETTDLDEARAEVARVYCPHYLSLTSPTGRLAVLHNGVRVGAVGLNYLRYGDEVRITPGRFENFYLVQIPLAGRARLRIGNREIVSTTRSGSMPGPSEPVDMVWSDGCEQLQVYLDRTAVERMAGLHSRSMDPVAVEFDPVVDLTRPDMRSWLRMVNVVREELESGSGLLTSELAQTHLEQLLIGGILQAQPNSAMSGFADSSGPATLTSRAVRDAVELIQEQPERAWRVSDLAEAVGVPVRQLQLAFHREHGIGPMESLKRVRLERARRDLIAMRTQDGTVSDVATRWGFFHLSRFSAAYREAFGELPSQTLST